MITIERFRIKFRSKLFKYGLIIGFTFALIIASLLQIIHIWLQNIQ